MSHSARGTNDWNAMQDAIRAAQQRFEQAKVSLAQAKQARIMSH